MKNKQKKMMKTYCVDCGAEITMEDNSPHDCPPCDINTKCKNCYHSGDKNV